MSAKELRALGHPLRLQILQMLHAEGPSTASALGRRLGESSGSMSYHLRALNRAGMVEDDERRSGRERWWRRVAGRTLIPNSIPPDVDEQERTELQAAHAQIESFYIERDEQALARWQTVRYEAPLAFQDAGFIGNFKIWATADELAALVAQILELTHPLRKPPAERPEGAREILFTLRTLLQEP
ncbi:MAG: ArsR/SmtB family transcription factor [Gaiellaceae bacterium]